MAPLQFSEILIKNKVETVILLFVNNEIVHNKRFHSNRKLDLRLCGDFRNFLIEDFSCPLCFKFKTKSSMKRCVEPTQAYEIALNDFK